MMSTRAISVGYHLTLVRRTQPPRYRYFRFRVRKGNRSAASPNAAARPPTARFEGFEQRANPFVRFLQTFLATLTVSNTSVLARLKTA